MKCRECPNYAKCVKESNLAIKRKHCPNAKTEKVKTNADRIRAMTDEELARQFAQYEYSVAKEVLAHFGVDISTMDYDAEVAAKNLLEQLQQPAEGDA